jgi:hypothetical protein
MWGGIPRIRADIQAAFRRHVGELVHVDTIPTGRCRDVAPSGSAGEPCEAANAPADAVIGSVR